MNLLFIPYIGFEYLFCKISSTARQVCHWLLQLVLANALLAWGEGGECMMSISVIAFQYNSTIFLSLGISNKQDLQCFPIHESFILALDMLFIYFPKKTIRNLFTFYFFKIKTIGFMSWYLKYLRKSKCKYFCICNYNYDAEEM